MSPYEQRLQNDLEEIRERLREVGEMVSLGLRNSIHALLTENRPLANETVLGDLPINRRIRAIDRQCHAFVARHMPSAGHLRFVSAVLRLTIGIERVGDYAATIAREVSQLKCLPPSLVVRDIELLSEQSQLMFKEAIRAFLESNAELARGTRVMESQVDVAFEKVFGDLLKEGEEGTSSVRDLFALLSVFNALERVSDQSKNICEETIFQAEGKTKMPKTYRVLFVSEKDSIPGQMAVAFAKKAFPGSLAAKAMEWKAEDSVSSEFITFMEQHGYGMDGSKSRQLDLTEDELGRFHVIVGLEPGAESHLAGKPFHTVYLEWDIAGDLAAAENASAESGLALLHRIVTHRVHELVMVLRGREAD